MNEDDLPDGSKVLLSPLALYNQIKEVLDTVGPEAFFRSPDEGVKSAREGLAILFYVSSLAQGSGKFWWIRQVGKGEQFPDFHIFMVDDDPLSFSFEGIELVEIPIRTASYEDALEIVKKKINKGYPPGYSLLVFLNNVNSTTWLPRLNVDLKSQRIFKVISTIHLLDEHRPNDTYRIIINKTWPLPVETISIAMEDLLAGLPNWPESIFEEAEINGRTTLRMRPEPQEELTAMMRGRLYPNRKARREAKRRQDHA